MLVHALPFTLLQMIIDSQHGGACWWKVHANMLIDIWTEQSLLLALSPSNAAEGNTDHGQQE